MPVGDTPTLAPLLRRFRLAAGLTQEELAEQSGVSARAVSDLERALRTAPRPETLRMLAAALGLDDQQRAELIAAARPETRQSQDAFPRERPTTLPLSLAPVPLPLTALIGRETELENLGQLLQSGQSRLVTLVGPGGVGKTHLCLEIARRMAGNFGDGIAFVDLSTIRRPELVPEEIAGALGVESDDAHSPVVSLARSLRYRSLLLILDNFEHLLDAASAISSLLESCPHLVVLATSRVRLRLRGEHVVTISPLEVPPETSDLASQSMANALAFPSVQLFLSRAHDAYTEFSIDERNAKTVAAICRHLDGLPLAIELAASLTSIFSPVTLLERLDHRLSVLISGSRDAPERQQTLAATIAWSYDLLEPDAQRTFQRLAVFSGGCSLEAAESVTAEPGADVTRSIQALNDHSLIRPSVSSLGVTRFTMLETVREFAESQFLLSSEVDEIRKRHRDWCLDLAGKAGSDIRASRNIRFWFETLDGELPNLRGAIEFMLSTGDGDGVIRLVGDVIIFLTDKSFYPDVARWLNLALALSKAEPTQRLVEAWGVMAFSEAYAGDSGLARQQLEYQQTMAETLQTPMASGCHAYCAAVVAEYGGDTLRAAEQFELAFRDLEEHAYPLWSVECSREMADKWVLLGRVDKAIPFLDRALGRARQDADGVQIAKSAIQRSYAAMAQDDLPLASSLLNEGLDLSLDYRLDRDALGAIGAIARLAVSNGRRSEAAMLLGAIEAARQSKGIGRTFNALHIARTVETMEGLLGAREFARLRDEGSTMSFDEAVALARQIANDTLSR